MGFHFIMFKVLLALAAVVALSYADCATEVADALKAYTTGDCAGVTSLDKVCPCVETYVKALEGITSCSDEEQKAIQTALDGLNASGFLGECNITLSSAAATTFSVVAAA